MLPDSKENNLSKNNKKQAFQDQISDEFTHKQSNNDEPSRKMSI